MKIMLSIPSGAEFVSMRVCYIVFLHVWHCM